MAEYQVVEIFTSINGEGTKAGQLATFVRMAGCNLSCSYCDTSWANQTDTSYQIMREQEIYETVKQAGVRNVTLTGGEPLYRDSVSGLLEALLQDDTIWVEIETNGSVALEKYQQLAEKYDGRLTFTMDYKLPDSGMEEGMCLKNFSVLLPKDTVKFVCSSMEDLKKAHHIMQQYQLIDRCHLYLSPVWGNIDPADMVEYLKEQKLNGVTLQLQLHKIIWDPNARGV